MSFDIIGATAAAVSLLGDTSVATVNLPMVPSKAIWKTHIIGTYDLCFPYMHMDYPTREEVFAYMQEAFLIHHNTNKHFGLGSWAGRTTVMMPPYMPKERLSDGGETVRATSPVLSYGI